jgi:hypothetical protein
LRQPFDRVLAPLPAAFVAPWLEDNCHFVSDLAFMKYRLADHVPKLRNELESAGRIRSAEPVQPMALSAVDAAVVAVELMDQVSILLQGIRVEDDGYTRLSEPQRVTGINGHVLQMLRTPLRVVIECRELAASRTLTIADNSYLSFLTEANQAIAHSEHSDNPQLAEAIKILAEEGNFLAMLENPFVISMSKRGESDNLLSGISDRTVLEFVLEGGEFTTPVRLVDGMKSKFGVERRGWFEAERNKIQDIYDNRLGVMFFKPHPWSRAYRIEGHLDHLLDDGWLMSMLAAISKHTVTRTIVEPWPQFMADYTAKRLSGIADLYGANNRHRLPISVPTRTALKGGRSR